MTASDLGSIPFAPSAEEVDLDPSEFEEVVINSQFKVNDDGTVDIAFLNVPILDVDDLFSALGEPQARADILLTIAKILAGRVDKMLEEVGFPIPGLAGIFDFGSESTLG